MKSYQKAHHETDHEQRQFSNFVAFYVFRVKRLSLHSTLTRCLRSRTLYRPPPSPPPPPPFHALHCSMGVSPSRRMADEIKITSRSRSKSLQFLVVWQCSASKRQAEERFKIRIFHMTKIYFSAKVHMCDTTCIMVFQ